MRSLVPIERKSTRGSSWSSISARLGTSSIAPNSIRLGQLAMRLARPFDLLLEQGARLLIFPRLGDHREHHPQHLAARRLDQRPRLRLHQGRAVERQAQRAPAHRRILGLLLGIVGEIGQAPCRRRCRRCGTRPGGRPRPRAPWCRAAAGARGREASPRRGTGTRSGTGRCRRRRSSRSAAASSARPALTITLTLTPSRGLRGQRSDRGELGAALLAHRHAVLEAGRAAAASGG